jgi:hypothetical protein
MMRINVNKIDNNMLYWIAASTARKGDKKKKKFPQCLTIKEKRFLYLRPSPQPRTYYYLNEGFRKNA